jgi:hypothetical protein
MSTRVHLVLDTRERDAYRARAAAEGTTLSDWLRQAARERLARTTLPRISTLEDLDRFFDERTAAESGREPDWDEHLGVMERSRRSGLETA